MASKASSTNRSQAIKASNLPPNVIRTRGQRFGVKIRYHGFPLRIGSAFCSPEDASVVVTTFRHIACIDDSGRICLGKKISKKFKDTYVNYYLPFSSTKNSVTVLDFLSQWLEKRYSKLNARDNTQRKKNAQTKLSILGKHQLGTKEDVTSKLPRGSIKNSTDTNKQGAGTKVLPKPVRKKQRNKFLVGDDHRHLDENSGEIVSFFDACLSEKGFNRLDDYVGVSEQRVQWQNWKHEIEIIVRTRENDYTSIESHSTEDHSESSSSNVLSESDREYFDADEEGLLSLNGRLDGISNMHIESLTPNKLHHSECKLPVLVAINGFWNSDFVSHGLLNKLHPKSGIVIEQKIVKTLFETVNCSTTAYFALDMNKISVGEYKFKLLAKDSSYSLDRESNSVDFEILGSKSYNSSEGYDDSRLGGNYDDASDSDNNSGKDFGEKDHRNDNRNISARNSGDFFYHTGFHGSGPQDHAKMESQTSDNMGNGVKLGAFDVESGLSFVRTKVQRLRASLPAMLTTDRWVLAFSILSLCAFIPNSARSTTLKTDPYLHGCFSVIENLGFTDISIKACSLFEDKAICIDKISHVAQEKGGMFSYGPEDYFQKVRDPWPGANLLEQFTCLLLPLSNYILLFGFPKQPYLRDRASYQYLNYLTMIEMLSRYASGYSMYFLVSPLVALLLSVGMETYVESRWSRGLYAKYRLHYRSFHVFLLFLCHFSIRPFAVKYFGKGGADDLPIVTLAFAPVCQRILAQSIPLLVATKKAPASIGWLLYLTGASLVLSFITAFSIDQVNVHTVFQLWPYYMAPYFVALSIATVLRYFDLPRIMLEPFCHSDSLEGWYF